MEGTASRWVLRVLEQPEASSGCVASAGVGMGYLQTLSLPLFRLLTYITEYYFLVPHLYLYTALLVILNFPASLAF